MSDKLENVKSNKEEAQSNAFAEELWKADPIDVKHGQCHSNANNGKEIEACHKQGAEDWETARKSTVFDLLKDKSPDQREKILKAEEQWEQFRESELDATAQYYFGSHMQSYENYSLTRSHTMYLRGGDADPNLSKDELETKLSDCQDGARSSGERAACIADYADGRDEELNQVYQRLMRQGDLTPKQEQAFRVSERAWIAYRDKQLEATKSMLPGHGQQSEAALKLDFAILEKERMIQLNNKIRYEGD